MTIPTEEAIFEQSIYMNPKEKVVIVVCSAIPKPTGMNTMNDGDFYAGVVKALR